MATGTIVRFDEVRGYGFIAPDGGGEDVFVHVNDLDDDKRAFVPGVLVEFDIATGERGLKASSVRLATRPPVRESRNDEYEFEDVLSPAEFRHEVTEALLEAVPAITGGQIVQVRQRLEQMARKYGWVES